MLKLPKGFKHFAHDGREYVIGTSRNEASLQAIGAELENEGFGVIIYPASHGTPQHTIYVLDAERAQQAVQS